MKNPKFLTQQEADEEIKKIGKFQSIFKDPMFSSFIKKPSYYNPIIKIITKP